MALTAPAPAGMMKMASGKLVPVSRPFGATKIKTRKFLIAIQFYEADRDAAEDLALLISDLERTRNHDADILLVNRADARPLGAATKAKLAMKFDKVMEHRCRRTDARGYPYGPNQMWSDLLMLMIQPPYRDDYFAFVNLETDCVPTRPGWITELIGAWTLAQSEQKHAVGFMHDNPVPHLNGVAIWSPNILRIVGGNQLTGSSPSVAFDIWHSKRIAPHATTTPLIHFSYRKPTITAAELFGAAALYHGVKDGSARAAVRARHITFTDRPAAVIPEIPAGINPPSFLPPENFGVAFPSLVGGVSHEEVSAQIKAEVAQQIQAIAAPADKNEIRFLENSVTELGTTTRSGFTTKRPNVYTYAHKHARVTKQEMAAIVEAWQKGWTSRGWNPVVLTLRDAAKHPRFEEFSAAVERLPCVGDKKWMAHRFYRWLALDSAGGGLLTDWDVLPNDFGPEIVTQHFDGNGIERVLTADDRMVGAYVDKANTSALASVLIAYDAQPQDVLGDKPHVTDATVLTAEIKASITAPTLTHFATTKTSTERKSVAMERFLAGN